MNWLRRLSIARRLQATAAVLILSMGGLATFTYHNLDQLVDLAQLTGNIRVPQLQRMAQLELNVTRASLQLRHAILARTDAERQATVNDIMDKRQRIEALLQDFQRNATTDTARALHAKAVPLANRFWSVAQENLQHIEAGRREEAFAFLVDRTIPARNDLLGVLDEAVKYQESRLRTDIAAVSQLAEVTETVQLGIVIVIGLTLLMMIGNVSGALKRRIATAREVTERIREGDMSAPVRDEARDEFSPLLTALSEMQSSLTRIVSTVRQNAESVALASTQIDQGNQDLSRRTEEQAGALQQTASTMEQLSSTVQHNADHARMASDLAMRASTTAAQGGTVVGEVVETMRGINESSRRISEIISVIDGIAFQTNILALNAAVEAARAGEQGRGFAVVASEVRNLAQRSAQAAREIKALIVASVGRVEQGTVLVDRAGQTMDEIVASIQRVADLVQGISGASQEQSQGFSQVGQAVSRMDHGTQQNAALVEQSAAAARSMKQQAQQLVEAMAVFRLGQEVAAKPAAPTAPARPSSRMTAARPETARPPAGRQSATTAANHDDWEHF